MQAIILAAGMGKRLKDLTSHATKCMVEVNGTSMIERALQILDRKRLSRIVIVVGYEGKKLIDYVGKLSIKTPIAFIENEIYDKTNNIYSLFLAKNCLLEEDTILLESDLVFEEAVIDRLLENPDPNLALVARYESWMDGTVVELDEENNILCFRSKKEFCFEETDRYYKTVNIYKFSKDFSQTHYVPFLEAYVKALGLNEYYEQVLKVISMLDKPNLKAVRLTTEKWYEIDDIQDLNIAESIFASKEEKLDKYQKRYGGYWRYPEMMDFCYLVNPYFPPQKMISEMKANFEVLLCNYPSGMDINSLLAAKCFSLKKENVVVGNGAAEIIKELMERLDGKLGYTIPTFEEYPNRKAKENRIPFLPKTDGFRYTADDLMHFYEDKDIKTLVLINPDNPTGNFIKTGEILRIYHWADEKGIRLIVDESFADFAECDESTTLLSSEILKACPKLIVVKSISKSYGVPGLRLGIAATYDVELISALKKDVAIWNINSFAEFYLQIYEKYESSYECALEKFKKVRKEYIAELSNIEGIKVYPSQANYVMCKVLAPYNSTELTKTLLEKYNILIKDLSGKNGFAEGSYIRIAVRNETENKALIQALKAEML